jgi:hypothetical protein
MKRKIQYNNLKLSDRGSNPKESVQTGGVSPRRVETRGESQRRMHIGGATPRRFQTGGSTPRKVTLFH